MARRAGHRLRDHAAVGQEHAGGQVARFARRCTECGAHQCLRLLFDDRDQAVPHHLHMYIGEFAHRLFLWSSTIWPALFTDASKFAVTSTVVWSSTISAGPATRAPPASAARSYTGTSRHRASVGSKIRRFADGFAVLRGKARALGARFTLVETVTD